jgi:hypothetical protein
MQMFQEFQGDTTSQGLLVPSPGLTSLAEAAMLATATSADVDGDYTAGACTDEDSEITNSRRINDSSFVNMSTHHEAAARQAQASAASTTSSIGLHSSQHNHNHNVIK